MLIATPHELHRLLAIAWQPIWRKEMLALLEEHAPAMEAIAASPPGLVKQAIAMAGMTILEFWQWLIEPGHLAAFLKVAGEFSTNPIQAINDLVALLATP
jgi:hypothetical protein